MKSGRPRSCRARRLSSRLVGLGLAALLALSNDSRAHAESPEEIDRRIEALVAERAREPLEGPAIATAVGAFLVSSGLSSAATVQWQCRDGDDCSNELRWGLTAGAGALALVGVVSVVLGGSELSRRLRRHREIADELCRLRNLKEPRARRPEPIWGLGVDWTGDRRELRVAVQF